MNLNVECQADGSVRVLQDGAPVAGVAFVLIHYHTDGEHPPAVTLEYHNGDQREFFLDPPNLQLSVTPALQTATQG